MKEFEKIIGYTSIKKELEQIADIFKNKEKYDNLGVNPPVGVLIHGVPGVGKSSMANALISAISLKCFVCRKDKPNGDFVKYIKETFDKATAEAPSIVFLDDMDKFANGDERHPDAEEYVTVQSCIDEVKNKNVLVLATANNLRCLPDSLLRAGRFDRIIEVDTPNIKDAEHIIKHYLLNKKVSDELDYKSIAKIMYNHSCAELETIINEAGIYAGFENSECIKMHHFLKAAMRLVFEVPVSAFEDDAFDEVPHSDLLKIAYHEAGHVLVHEILDPDSVALVSMFGSNYGTFGGRTVFKMGALIDDFMKNEISIIAGLGGMAAVEQKFGAYDLGCSEDLSRVFNHVSDLITNNCTSGLHLHGDFYDISDELRSKQEQAVATEVEKYYRKAKEIISSNNIFFENIAKELLDKKILCSKDIQNIKYSSSIK